MSKKFNQYIGKAGHLHIMSEFLMLGWNVGMPEVDRGDDIFVVHDDIGTFRRVQVKTSTSTTGNERFSGTFSVSIKNLKKISNIGVHFVFIVRHNHEWLKPIIIKQNDLLSYFEKHQIGYLAQTNLILTFTFSNNKVLCSGLDFTKYLNNFIDFPKIEH